MGSGHHDHDRDHVHPHAHAHHGHGARQELVASLACGAVYGLARLSSALDASPNVAAALDFIALTLGAFFTIRDAYQKVLLGRFEIDFLMIVAAIGAATIDKVAEGALLLFLFSLGHALESLAMGRAKHAIGALAELAPRTARRVLPDGAIAEVPLAEVAPGMRLHVLAHARVPADGIVVRGQSSVDESPVTGESLPVDKRAVAGIVADPRALSEHPHEHRVFAGTLNGPGDLEIVASAAASDSTLARVVRLVAEAEAAKAPLQRKLERFERIFVPCVLAFDVLLLFAWVVVDEPFSQSFYRAMAVLVAASPCALAIALPSAVLAGVARAARGGVLIKGGQPLVALAGVEVVAFDKTGTLTHGTPRLLAVTPVPGVEAAELAAVACALEHGSSHPIARAVVDGLATRGFSRPAPADAIEALIGAGVAGRVQGAAARCGKPALFSAETLAPVRALIDQHEARGETVVVVARDERVLGVLALADGVRPDARALVAELGRLGIGEVVMLTGDNAKVAQTIGEAAGISRVESALMPADKVRLVAELERERRVLMVGDGVNDAPALATATVGVAMGAAGSPIALETADVALMGDELDGLPFVLRLARKTRAIIRQNLVASFAVVAVLVPLTVLDQLGMGLAVVAHEGVTVLVVLNALRLLGFRGDLR